MIIEYTVASLPNSPILAKGATLTKWTLTGSVSAILAGLLHILIGITGLTMPTVYNISTLYGSGTQLVSGVLTVIGVFELSYGFMFRGLKDWKKFEPVLVMGILGFLFSLALYFVSLATPLLFGVPQQTIAAISIVPFVAKVLEVIFVVSAVRMLRAIVK